MAIGFNLPNNYAQPSAAGFGGVDLGQAISKGLSLGLQPRSQQEQLLQAMLTNKIKSAQAKYAEDLQRANLAHIGAQTGLLGEQTKGKGIENEFLRDKILADLGLKKAQTKYYDMGGAGGSTGSKDYLNYVAGVQNDNPNLNEQQIQEAANVLAQGGTTLSDGTPLNPMSFGTGLALNRAVKATTTAQQINQGLSANQAEAELGIFNKIAEDWTQPYANTYFNKSPQAFYDSFKNDDESQKRLGKFIAGQAIQFESAGLRGRQANAPASITAIEELMKHSGQVIDARFPRVSAKARKYASQYLQEALNKGLEARNKIGIGPGYLVKKQHEANKNEANLINENELPNNVTPTGAKVGVTLKDGSYNFVDPHDIQEHNGKTYYYINGKWRE